jgi:hypothetical protein
MRKDTDFDGSRQIMNHVVDDEYPIIIGTRCFLASFSINYADKRFSSATESMPIQWQVRSDGSLSGRNDKSHEHNILS